MSDQESEQGEGFVPDYLNDEAVLESEDFDDDDDEALPHEE